MRILAHLQKNATGNHEIDILALQNAMRQYHHTYSTIVEYITALELSQKKNLSKPNRTSLTQCSLPW